jgi:hypothetical protein
MTGEGDRLMRFADQAGTEMFESLVRRAEQLGAVTLEEMVGALSGATAVCLANVLRPAVEAAPDRGAAADRLVATCTRQARRFLEPVVGGAD